MNEKNPASPEITPPKKKRRRFVGFLILLLIGTSFLSYVLWQRAGRLQQQIYQQINPLITQVTTLEEHIKTFQSQYEQKSEIFLQSFDNQIKTLVQQQQHLQDNLAVLTHQVQQPQDNTQWIVAEITYLLNIAHQRLLLMKDADGALTAVMVAYQRLNTLNHPALYELKTQLAKDIEDLKRAKRPPIKTSAKKLADYMTQVEQLPLAQGQRQADSPPHPSLSTQEEVKSSFGVNVWKEVHQLITIRYRSKTEGEFLTEEQRYFVIQTLRLKLEIAHLFLLSQDFENFATALESVQDWLNRYYDQNDDIIKKLINDLKEMRVETSPLPDLSFSLKALQNLTAATLLPKPDENVSQ